MYHKTKLNQTMEQRQCCTNNESKRETKQQLDEDKVAASIAKWQGIQQRQGCNSTEGNTTLQQQGGWDWVVTTMKQ